MNSERKIKCCERELRTCKFCKRDFCGHYKTSINWNLCYDCADKKLKDWVEEITNETN